MQLIIAKDSQQFGEIGANVVCQVVKNKPNAVLGFATGSTPIAIYEKLVEKYQKGEISFKNAFCCNIDEYVGLDKNHPQSYAYFMRKHLFDHVDVNFDNVEIPSGIAKNLLEECKRYKEFLAYHPRDLQILGLGQNGHIGFNEPYTPFGSKTHVVCLSKSTIEANSRFFTSVNHVPTKAITMGITELMTAKRLLVLACGRHKAEVVKDMILGACHPHLPCSVVQLHPDATILLDSQSASLLPDYLKE